MIIDDVKDLKKSIDKKKVYSKYDRLPKGSAPDTITPGCLVLEGGAFRGCYTTGVLDCLMRHGLNFECTVGVSAGALNGYNYAAGQIGRAARFNLGFRHDSRYVGLKASIRNKGAIGFDFLFENYPDAIEPFDEERFSDPRRRFIAVATDCETGETAYLEKGKVSDITKAVAASASMPFISKMVELDGHKYLDGGISDKIGYSFALKEGYEKIIVVNTRPADFRKKDNGSDRRTAKVIYGKKYPSLTEKLSHVIEMENEERDELELLAASGRVFMLSPSKTISVGRLEPDMEKLGRLYALGYHDAKTALPKIREYLAKEVN
jgi:predicted patatin/cPLA2 family phospholipase